MSQPDLEEAQETLYAFVRKQLRRAVTEKYKIASQLSVPIPYIFLTPKVCRYNVTHGSPIHLFNSLYNALKCCIKL